MNVLLVSFVCWKFLSPNHGIRLFGLSFACWESWITLSVCYHGYNMFVCAFLSLPFYFSNAMTMNIVRGFMFWCFFSLSLFLSLALSALPAARLTVRWTVAPIIVTTWHRMLSVCIHRWSRSAWAWRIRKARKCRSVRRWRPVENDGLVRGSLLWRKAATILPVPNRSPRLDAAQATANCFTFANGTKVKICSLICFVCVSWWWVRSRMMSLQIKDRTYYKANMREAFVETRSPDI